MERGLQEELVEYGVLMHSPQLTQQVASIRISPKGHSLVPGSVESKNESAPIYGSGNDLFPIHYITSIKVSQNHFHQLHHTW